MRNYTALFFAFTAFCLCFNQCVNGQSLFSNFKDITPLAAGVENAIIVDIDNDNDQDVLFIYMKIMGLVFWKKIKF